MIKLFIELDGALLDLQGDWEDRAVHDPNWLLTLPLANKKLWAAAKPFNPTMLSTVPRDRLGLAYQKREWVSKHLGPEYEFIAAIKNPLWIWCEERDHILISANSDSLKNWAEAGGIAYNIPTALKKLKDLSIDELIEGDL